MAFLGYRVAASSFNIALLIYLWISLVQHVHHNTTATGVASIWNLLLIIVEVLFIGFVANQTYGTATGTVGRTPRTPYGTPNGTPNGY